MTTYYQGELGKKPFGIGVFLFAHGLIWFDSSRSQGIFTLLPLSDVHGSFNIFHRAEIVIGAIVAAYGMLLWRSASRELSLANYIIVLSCVPALLLCVSKLSQWVYFLDQQRGFSILNALAVGVIQIMMVVFIVVFGGWWADSAYMHERFRGYMRSSRFVK
jgi:drug/metabolite transporter (DMT)-like permease